MQLYLVRHAHADFAETDEIRPLTSKGWKQVRRLVENFRGKGLITPHRIWSSALTRARETAQGLKDGLELEAPLTKRKGLAPYDDPAGIACQIEDLSDSAMVVGHEPNLSRLASLILQESSACDRVIFAKASILCLSRMKIGTQSTPWQIEWHINQKLLK